MTVELPTNADVRLLAFAATGLIAGLVLLARGIPGYRAAIRIGDTAASRISSLAVGEALVTGTVEPAELTLVSALQSAPCIFYRSRIQTDDDSISTSFREERAVGFRLRDATGDVRVFPRGAAFDVPDAFSERDGMMGDRPPGLDLRTGSPFAPGPADREGQVAALLSLGADSGATLFDAGRSVRVSMPAIQLGGSRRSYHEARIAPGDIVTVVGRALPFDQLPDPGSADLLESDPLTDDPEIAADLAAARAAGTLEAEPLEAWGNAAIPGFGIGRPTRAPELDPAANELPVAAGTPEAALAERTFAIPPDALVLAAARDAPLVISLGAPAAAEWRHRRQFLVGLLGAVLAIVSAMALAIMVGGPIRGGGS
jgi:hypothetical protein